MAQPSSLLVLIGIALVVGMGACKPKPRTMVEYEEVEKEPLPGSDRDEHGCIGSAGYVWSEVLQDCIRVWEVGIELAPVQEGRDASFAGKLVTGKAPGMVEVFIREQPGGILLRGENGKWSDEAGNYHLTTPQGGGYELRDQSGTLMYRTVADPEVKE